MKPSRPNRQILYNQVDLQQSSTCFHESCAPRLLSGNLHGQSPKVNWRSIGLYTVQQSHQDFLVRKKTKCLTAN